MGVSLGRLVGVRRKIPFPYGKIYYISNLDVFRKMINEITLSLCVRLKVFFLYVDERYLKGQKISCSIKMKRLQPKVFRSESLKGDDIGCLYSELVVLNM